MTDVIKQAAEAAIRGTRCTYSIAREITVRVAADADADGIAYDAGMLADVVGERLLAEGWI